MKAWVIKQPMRAVAGAVALLLSLVLSGRAQTVNEAVLSDAQFKKMDVFESSVLSVGDKHFVEKKYRQAVTDYEAFLIKYPKSLAVPYAILRKGRSYQLDNKRFEAIKVYTDVLDYYPNAVDYAGAALYYTGDCHFQNGNLKEAMKAWAEMAKDVDYRKHILAALALNRLADNLMLQDKWVEAEEYYEQAATDFRRTNRQAVEYAIKQIRLCYVRKGASIEKLRKVYYKLEGFDWRPMAPNETNFCERVMESVDALGDFAETQQKEKAAYFRYWATQLEGKHPAWDEYQLAIARYRLGEDGNVNAWYGRVDRQYAQHQKEDDFDRTIRFLQQYAGHLPKINEYYARLAFGRMSKEYVIKLITVLYRMSQGEMGRNAIGKLPATTTDADRVGLMRPIDKDREAAELLCEGIKDMELANLTLLRFYGKNPPSKGPLMDRAIRVGEIVVKSPANAKEGYMILGDLHMNSSQWEEAISCYRLADDPPKSLYKIVSCFQSWKKRSEALAQLSEIENFFPPEASRACLLIADVWNGAGEKKLYIAQLRTVLKKYPASGESSTAHQRLQAMGEGVQERIGGGTNAE